MPKRNNLWANIDWITIALYMGLVLMGWLNIYSSVYNDEFSNIFDVSQRYGKQIIWIGAALLLAFVILRIDTNFYVFFAYIIYGFIVFLLIVVLFVGNEINGARSWFNIGSFGFQPSEFCKFATALALAKYMSTFGFKFMRVKSFLTIGAIIFVPAIFILLQNDTGSALVYFSFVLVLYREGLSGVFLFSILLVGVLFVFALIMPAVQLYLILVALVILALLVLNPKIKQFLIALSVFLGTSGVAYLGNLILKSKYEISMVLGAGLLLGALIVFGISLSQKIKNYIIISIIFIGAILFTQSVDYAFNNILEPHHQARINELLGIKSDPLGAGYNVNQSKIAIGSGGFSGKGFLKGTQTKFDFVPAQTTDFIFCTVGEEWGFIGTTVVILLFLFLFVRLLILAERQRSGFSRIYGYAVAVILFFHFMVNIGMTIGVMPVIGIPLPFFSYGGSSLWSFTILLFIFIRLDSSRLDHLSM